MVLITLGLISSTFHLANRRNGWRAVSRIRTSWLVREGALAIAFYPLAFGYIYWVWQVPQARHSVWFVALSLVTLFAIGMIYACLKTIRQWHNALTPIHYILLGVMLGGLIFLLLVSYFGLFSASLVAVIKK